MNLLKIACLTGTLLILACSPRFGAHAPECVGPVGDSAVSIYSQPRTLFSSKVGELKPGEGVPLVVGAVNGKLLRWILGDFSQISWDLDLPQGRHYVKAAKIKEAQCNEEKVAPPAQVPVNDGQDSEAESDPGQSTAIQVEKTPETLDPGAAVEVDLADFLFCDMGSKNTIIKNNWVDPFKRGIEQIGYKSDGKGGTIQLPDQYCLEVRQLSAGVTVTFRLHPDINCEEDCPAENLCYFNWRAKFKFPKTQPTEVCRVEAPDKYKFKCPGSDENAEESMDKNLPGQVCDN